MNTFGYDEIVDIFFWGGGVITKLDNVGVIYIHFRAFVRSMNSFGIFWWLQNFKCFWGISVFCGCKQ